jgi:hypothetical protein
MRYIIAASVVGAAMADTSGNVNVASGCVASCSPLLYVSSQCKLPVPANYAVALNPTDWTTNTWGNLFSSNWGSWGLGNGWGAGTSGWGTGTGAGFGGYFGGWKSKRDTTRSPAVVPAAVGANAWGSSVNWGGLNWGGILGTNNINCVCNSNTYNMQDVGSDCLTCLSQVGVSNPCKSSNIDVESS